VTHLVERLVELSKHLDHLDGLRPRVTSAGDLERDLSLHNDLLFSLLTVCQLVIDISGELSARHRLPFNDYTTAVRNLEHIDFPPDVVESLARLPDFRNVLLRDCFGLDLGRAVEALQDLEPVRRFAAIVAERERESGSDS
jgi:uncharacterized protein YutE (UPF0331/DUF86 family)